MGKPRKASLSTQPNRRIRDIPFRKAVFDISVTYEKAIRTYVGKRMFPRANIAYELGFIVFDSVGDDVRELGGA